jgi:hypothetical protein
MKAGGFLFLLSGWTIVIAAAALLTHTARTIFVLAGMGVEIIGFVFVVRSHLVLKGDRS